MHRRPQFEPLARLAAAGCGLFGPWVLRGLYCPAGRGCSGPSSRVGALILPGAAAAALAAGALWGWLCRLGLGRVRGPSSCVGAFVLLDAAAAAMAAGALLGGCAAWDWAGCVPSTRVGAFVLVGAAAPALAAGRFWVGCALIIQGEHCTAPADMLQLHGTLPASFPLINNRPLSERAAGASRRGSGGAQTFPYGCAATGPHIAGLWHGKAYTRVLRGLGAARRRICADGICACLSQMYLFIIRK